MKASARRPRGHRRSALALGTACVAAMLALAGCSNPAVHGTITAKTYLPGSTSYVNTPVYSQRCTTTEEEEEEDEPGPNGTEEEEPEEEPETTCTSYVSSWRLVPVEYPSCYQLTVSGKQGGTVCVTETQYASVKIGGTW